MADKREPYVGPRPFKKDESDLFFGRDQEADELVSLITAHPVVLFYAQSGAGKSSLLNAKVVPKLGDEEDFEVLGPLRIQGQIPANFVVDKKANIYVLNALLSYSEGANPAQLASLTLPEFFKRLAPRLNKFNENRPRVIIFDQFEELFTSYPDRWEDRTAFFEQVHDAIAGQTESKIPLRVVFAMREDYIAELDPYAPLLPEKLRTRYRLERLREHAALSAIIKPLQGTGRSYSPGVAEQIVENLRKIPGHSVGDDAKLGPYIEPVQLQVVCQSIWQALGPNEIEITQKHLKDYGDVNRALSAFYERSIRTVAEKTGVTEAALRTWFGNTLITSDGMRAPVYRGVQKTEGLPNNAVDLLDGMQLLKSELKGTTARWYELAHDRFIEPVRKSNEKWLAEQSIAEQARLRLESKAERWRQGHGGLLSAAEFAEAKRLLRGQETASEDLRALVDASEASTQKKRLKWLTWGAAVLTLLLVGVAGLTVYAFNQRNAAIVAGESAMVESKRAVNASDDAKRQRDEATAQRNIAENARKTAENQEGLTRKALEDVKTEKAKTEEQRKTAEIALLAANEARDREKRKQQLLEEKQKIVDRQSKILTSEGGPTPISVTPENTAGFDKIKDDARDAVDFLNHLFGETLPVPEVKLLQPNYRNAFWDGKAFNAPVAIQYLPDVTYHDVAFLHIANALGNITAGSGEAGAIAYSYSDIYAMLIKQKKLGQTAQQSDWTLVPGAIAWLSGEDPAKSSDRRPLRSLKSPGTAYNDPLIGKDPQVAHMKDFVKTESDNGGVHVNSGILNKAFYEAAIQIGSDRAGNIWTQALKDPGLRNDLKFQRLADITYQAAKTSEESQAIKNAWKAVGISVGQN